MVRAADEKDPPTGQTYDLTWGPVALDVAEGVGALHGATSRLITLRATPTLLELMREARREFPKSILPRGSDTPETLAARLSETDFLDDMHFPIGGHGTAMAEAAASGG